MTERVLKARIAQVMGGRVGRTATVAVMEAVAVGREPTAIMPGKGPADTTFQVTVFCEAACHYDEAGHQEGFQHSCSQLRALSIRLGGMPLPSGYCPVCD